MLQLNRLFAKPHKTLSPVGLFFIFTGLTNERINSLLAPGIVLMDVSVNFMGSSLLLRVRWRYEGMF
jgi:hypothetical protein